MTPNWNGPDSDLTPSIEYGESLEMESRADRMREYQTPLDLALASIQEAEQWYFTSMARGLIRGYDAYWGNSQSEISLLSCEKTYQSDLVNLSTGKPSRTFKLAGKLDKLCQQDGTVLFDHKTTTMDIEDPDAPYWRQLTVESQPSHYELLLHMNGIAVDRVIWDVVRKPGIRPRKITKKELEELQNFATWQGFDVDGESLEFASQCGRENALLYEHRVAAECVSNPHRYFARRQAKRTQDEIAEYAVEIWDVATEMRESRVNERHYRNSGACMNYGTPCRFLGVCSGYDTVDSDNWYTVDQVHNELTDVTGDGKDLLTNSRLRCFQTCRRKHFYEYECGVRRVNEEEKEALYFGTLFHDALDVYWRHSTRRED